jgi:amino acid transporter
VFASVTANLAQKYVLHIPDKYGIVDECVIERVYFLWVYLIFLFQLLHYYFILQSPVPECQFIYIICVCVFSTAVLVIMLFEVDRLRFLNTFFAIYRIVALVLMVVSCVISLAINGPRWGENSPTEPPNDHWYSLKWGGFTGLFGATATGLLSDVISI